MRQIIDEKVKFLIKHGEFNKLKNYNQHNNYSTFDHCIAVAEQAMNIVEKFNIKINVDELITAALLHDYYLYDWHTADKSHRLHGFSHGKKAMLNAVNHYKINKRQQQAIERHMFPLTLPPTTKLGIIITLADKMCATKEVFVTKPNLVS
jgi:uncharacterized protein